MSQNNQTSDSTSYHSSKHQSNLEIMGNSPLGVVQEFPEAIVAAAAANSSKRTQHETAPTSPIPPPPSAMAEIVQDNLENKNESQVSRGEMDSDVDIEKEMHDAYREMENDEQENSIESNKNDLDGNKRNNNENDNSSDYEDIYD